MRLLLLAALAAGPAAAEAPPPPGTPETALAEPFGEPLTDGAEIEARTLTLAHGLRCPVCQGMSVADSSSEAAVNMKNRIRELVTAGYTDDQIEDYFIDRYGTWVLLEPPDDGVNRALYLAPGAALLVGLGVVGWVLTARRRRDAAPPAPTPNPTDDAYTRRVLAELEED